jgi:hypothetical protein
MEQRYGKAKGVISRQCSRCDGDLGDRYGKQRYCKACHAKHMREHRPKHRDLLPEARKKANARAYANVYLKRGIIKKKDCECGSSKSQMHHPDYDKPLEVIWMCRACHLKHHKLNGKTD